MKQRMAIFLAVLTFAAVIGALYAVFLTSGGRSPATDEHAIAFMNGAPIEAEELQLFTRPGGSLNAISHPQGNGNEDAMRDVMKAKLVQLEAVSRGLLADSSYAAFVKEWELENQRRSQALQRGEVIYGPKQYALRAYYDYRQSLLFQSVKNIWSQQRLTLTESALLAFYDRHKETLARKQDRITLYKLMAPNEQRIREWQSQLDDGATFMELFDAAGAESGAAAIERIDPGNYREISKYRSGLYDLATRMREGEVSDLWMENQTYMILLCAEREASGYLPFAEVREEVVNRYRDAAFETYLEGLLRNAEVRYTSRYEALAAATARQGG
ncbi:peptidyl-prolyl cis-trans isomerase [Paenibacillus aurantiacus]|uniref:Peptidyl-prolyl cis-trans isomerase n=1 Tax=Paenibacillus aurantiacus TaxID=1936118 RepID=A0ABV5KRD7_9BACL